MPTPGKELEVGGRVDEVWREVNANSVAVRDLQRRVLSLEQVIQRLTQFSTVVFPFKVYSRTREQLDEVDRPDAWRKFRVRHGYVFAGGKVKTTGCDDADGEGTTPVEITVEPPDPEDIDPQPYEVWIEVTLDGDVASAAEVKHGPDGWAGIPDPVAVAGKFMVHVASIDIFSKARNQAVIRQYVREDIRIAGTGGGDARYS